jgi:hypothetical protein
MHPICIAGKVRFHVWSLSAPNRAEPRLQCAVPVTGIRSCPSSTTKIVSISCFRSLRHCFACIQPQVSIASDLNDRKHFPRSFRALSLRYANTKPSQLTLSTALDAASSTELANGPGAAPVPLGVVSAALTAPLATSSCRQLHRALQTHRANSPVQLVSTVNALAAPQPPGCAPSMHE